MNVDGMKTSAATVTARDVIAVVSGRPQTKTSLTYSSDSSRVPYVWKWVAGICRRLFAALVALANVTLFQLP